MKFKRGMQGYAQILAALRTPMTVMALASALGREKTASDLGITMRKLHKLGIVHIQSWNIYVGKGPAVRVYGVGSEPDADYPLMWRKRNFVRSQPKQAAPPVMGCEMVAFGVIWRALEQRATVQELEELSGSSNGTLLRLVRHMRRLKLIYVHAWDNNAPIYKLGNRADQKRPKRKTSQEYSATYEARIKESRRYEQLYGAFA